MKNRNKLITFLVLICVACFSLYSVLSRPVWYDEAWSIMVYAIRPIKDIYINYNAPNNHILFNIFLNIWWGTVGSLFQGSEIPFRLMTLVTSLITISLMFKFWHKRLGLYATFLTILCFIVSTPFMVYGTAIRGYMLSLLFIVCGLESALRYIETQKKKYVMLYFLSALAAVGVIPSNLFAFAAITLIPPRKCEFSKQFFASFLKKRWLLAVLPILAFFMFYGWIFNSLLIALKNNNGWLHPSAACIHLYSALIIFLAPVVLLSITGINPLIKTKRIDLLKILLFSIIFLFPALIMLMRKPAPFPRVFLQLWPIWLFIIGIGIKHLFGLLRKNKTTKRALCFYCSLMTLIIVGMGICNTQLASTYSTLFTRRYSHDDFFSPAYMRENFKPIETVDKLIKLSGGKPNTVYLSQNSDWFSIIFYGELMGIDQDSWITEYPGKAGFGGAGDAEKYYILARNKDDLSLIKGRYGLENVEAVSTGGLDKIYVVNRKTKLK